MFNYTSLLTFSTCDSCAQLNLMSSQSIAATLKLWPLLLCPISVSEVLVGPKEKEDTFYS